MKIRASIEIEFIRRGGSKMSDWIKDLKKKEADTASQRETADQIRLHNAKIIASKAHSFWMEVLKFVDEISKELHAEFPNNKKYHCHKNPSYEGFVLVNDGPLPRRELTAEINIAGHMINLYGAVKSDRYKPAVPKRPWQIDITVNDQEELVFRWEFRIFTTPEDLARALVKYVCEIDD